MCLSAYPCECGFWANKQRVYLVQLTRTIFTPSIATMIEHELVIGLEWHTAIAYFANTHKSWEIMLFHCGEGLSAGGSIASVSHFLPSWLGTNSA